MPAMSAEARGFLWLHFRIMAGKVVSYNRQGYVCYCARVLVCLKGASPSMCHRLVVHISIFLMAALLGNGW